MSRSTGQTTTGTWRLEAGYEVQLLSFLRGMVGRKVEYACMYYSPRGYPNDDLRECNRNPTDFLDISCSKETTAFQSTQLRDAVL